MGAVRKISSELSLPGRTVALAWPHRAQSRAAIASALGPMAKAGALCSLSTVVTASGSTDEATSDEDTASDGGGTPPKLMLACSGCHQLVKCTSAGRWSCPTATSPSMAARSERASAAASAGGGGNMATAMTLAFPKCEGAIAARARPSRLIEAVEMV